MEDETPAVRKRILVSENHPDFALVVRIRLESSGYEVRVSLDPLETIELARAWRPDLITTDLCKAPAMDGLEMIEQLKANDITEGIPVIVVSAGVGSEEGRQRALDAGAYATLPKPICGFDDLRCLVQEVLGP